MEIKYFYHKYYATDIQCMHLYMIHFIHYMSVCTNFEYSLSLHILTFLTVIVCDYIADQF